MYDSVVANHTELHTFRLWISGVTVIHPRIDTAINGTGESVVPGVFKNCHNTVDVPPIGAYCVDSNTLDVVDCYA